MPHYALARHVFACQDGDHIVLLDLKQDRYLALKAVATSGLAALVRGWPAGAAALDNTAASTRKSMDVIVRALLDRELLSVCDDHGGQPGVSAPCAAVKELPLEELNARRSAPLRSITTLLAASISAALQLRCRSLERVVLGVQQRKAAASIASRSFDFEAAGPLVQDFNLLRPFLFTARDACLFNSLVLLGFLARHRLYPDWVFGVQTQPFAAHCWIQHQTVVLNDTVEHVSRYTPIMVI